ncbi:hypothetical protein BE17_31370 [Sorangium cellulosum]|uniref:ABC transporter ATP-binding protein n=1 Tax=Sorangium cellulosum TaxID=56 RepID=A0A150RYC8_SORCE|nr:hypothetical protein BE17_31370 [Sorangium cellulosum]
MLAALVALPGCKREGDASAAARLAPDAPIPAEFPRETRLSIGDPTVQKQLQLSGDIDRLPLVVPAVLLVTHDVDEAISLADRVLVLVEGRIAEEQRIELPAPRPLRHPRSLGHRESLLAALGVAPAAAAAEDVDSNPEIERSAP